MSNYKNYKNNKIKTISIIVLSILIVGLVIGFGTYIGINNNQSNNSNSDVIDVTNDNYVDDFFGILGFSNRSAYLNCKDIPLTINIYDNGKLINTYKSGFLAEDVQIDLFRYYNQYIKKIVSISDLGEIKVLVNDLELKEPAEHENSAIYLLKDKYLFSIDKKPIELMFSLFNASLMEDESTIQVADSFVFDIYFHVNNSI